VNTTEVHTLWKPIGQLSKTPFRPENCVEGERWRSGMFRESLGKECKKGAHCAHRKGLWTCIAPLSRHLPLFSANGCNQGPSASPGTHCIREPSGSACVPQWHGKGEAYIRKIGDEVGHSEDGTNVSVWSSFGMLLSAKAGSFCSSSRNTSNG
jgi:hypothetical protein